MNDALALPPCLKNPCRILEAGRTKSHKPPLIRGTAFLFHQALNFLLQITSIKAGWLRLKKMSQG
jgi:hypothetical protein